MDFVPPAPETIEQAGLSESMVEQLILKALYFQGETLGRDLANSLGLKFSLIEDVVEFLKREHRVLAKSSLGMGSMSAIFVLSESGRKLAREYLDANRYSGYAPVPIEQYAEGVRAQRRKANWLTREKLDATFRDMVLDRNILKQIGPAVSAGRSLLIYGYPGNGKTYMSETLRELPGGPIYVPYALESGGNIIRVYDPMYHQRIEENAASSLVWDHAHDGRWFQCKRPFIVSGGELTLDMLDLSFNLDTKVYDAPLHLKANNGIYLIDDFGRQKTSPAEVLDRWIIPMDRRVDYLSFQNGGKMIVPFEVFLIFSTNLDPFKLGDEAFRRRLQYKVFLKSPDEDEFREIFLQYCGSCSLECPPELLDSFLEKHYRKSGMHPRRCHPRDIISHAIDLMSFERLPAQLTGDILDRAFASCFLDSGWVEE